MSVRPYLSTLPLASTAALVPVAAAFGQSASSPPEIPADFADAPAIVVEHEVDWDLWIGKSSTRVKKRVLIRRDAGSEQADQSIFFYTPDSELRHFSARTIQPDGSVVPVPE